MVMDFRRHRIDKEKGEKKEGQMWGFDVSF